MRVFITGIAGFLGSHIAREGKALGWDVSGIDSMLGGSAENVPPDIAWEEADCRAFPRYQHMLDGADVVYHCAAAPYEGLSVFSPNVVFANTLMSTTGVLTAAINARAGRFVFCSSMSRYGHQKAPFTEDMPAAPADPYAIAKVASEQLVRNLCELHGMEWVIAVPHNIYGPGQRYWDPFRNVAGIFINRVLQGKPPIIYGDGSQRRCLSYITDVSDPLLRMAFQDSFRTGDDMGSLVPGEIFNIGPDEGDVTILDLAEAVLKLTGSTLEPVFFPARPAEVREAHCSAAKARKMLNYTPSVSLEEGLAGYIEWIREKGPRAFDYHLPIEIDGKDIPRTWSERLM